MESTPAAQGGVDNAAPLSQPQGLAFGAEEVQRRLLPFLTAGAATTKAARIGFLDEGNIFDAIRDIRDPEHPQHTLEELGVVQETCIAVIPSPLVGPRTRGALDPSGAAPALLPAHFVEIRIGFTPTVPNCSLATLIGLCIRVRLERDLEGLDIKLDIAVTPGSHATVDDVNKQINDKERVAAALENPALAQVVERSLRRLDPVC